MRLLDPIELRRILADDPAVRAHGVDNVRAWGTVALYVRETMQEGGWHLGPEPDRTEASVEAYAAWLAEPAAPRRANVIADLDPEDGDRLAALAVTYYTRRHPAADARRLAVAANLLAEWGAGLWGGWPAADDLQEWAQAMVFGVLGASAQLDADQPTGLYLVPESLTRGAPPTGMTPEATARLVVALLDQLLFGPRAPALPEEATTLRLLRTGQGPLTFRGRRLAAVTGPIHGQRVLDRWYDLVLYRSTEEGGILEIIYRTRRPGEIDHHTALRLATLESDLIVAELRGYDPLAPVLGFPPGEAFQAKQERLERTLRQIYDARITALLGLIVEEA